MSDAQLYDLVVTGHSSELKVADLVQKLMKILEKKSAQLEFKLSEALIFEQNANTALEGVTQDVAQHYQAAFAKLQVTSEIRPTIQVLIELEGDKEIKVYHCPACGHEQPKVLNRLDMCDICGVIGDKYASTTRMKAIMEDERRRIAQAQAQNVRESLAHAEHQQRLKLRRTALKRLGIKEQNRIPIMIAAIVGFIGVGCGSFYGFYKWQESKKAEEEELAQANQPAAGTFDPKILAALSNKAANSPNLTDHALALVDNGLLPGAPVADAAQYSATSSGTNHETAIKEIKSHKGYGYDIVWSLEKAGLAYPRFKRETAQYMVDQAYCDKLLDEAQWDMAIVFIDTLTDPAEQAAMYNHALLYLARKNPAALAAQASIILAKLKANLEKIEATNEAYPLVLSAITGLQAMQLDDKATQKSVEQLINYSVALKGVRNQLILLQRLANEQYLFDNRPVAGQLLLKAEQLLAKVSAEQQADLAGRLSASYFILEDEANSLRLSEQVHEPAQRDKLFKTLEAVRSSVKAP